MTDDEVKAANENPLCDRLDEINRIAHEALRWATAGRMMQALEDIRARSAGFMKIPDQGGRP